jgi:hypothetical protein
LNRTWLVLWKQVHVLPFDHEEAKAAIAATHTKKPKEGVKPRRERRLEYYRVGA